MNRPTAFLALSVCSMSMVGLTGCALTSTSPTSSPLAAMPTRGNVHGGQQPIVGAHVYVLAAATTGYGNASVSLLDPTVTGQADSIGAYVVTDANGDFDVTNAYSCIPGTQVYLYGQGGDPGAGANSAASLMAILGNCPAAGTFAEATPYVAINEVSTVAAAYAIAGFATDATHVASSGTPLATTGIANAFANSANLADLASGAAVAKTPDANGIVPQKKINTLANILAACINSTGSGSLACSTLFGSTSSGSVSPSDTASAAIALAHHPGVNVAPLFFLTAATSPYYPSLVLPPNDFTLALSFPGSGGPGALAVDSTGSVWVANFDNNTAAKLLPSGVPAAGSPFQDPSFNGPFNVAIDTSDNAWVVNANGNSVTELSTAGSPASGSPFTGGGLNQPFSIAIDGSNGVWVTNFRSNAIAKLQASGVPAPGSPFVQPGLLAPFNIAVDATGQVWIPDYLGNSIFVATSNGTPTQQLPLTGGGLLNPTAVAIDAAGDAWVSNYWSNTATEVLANGTFASSSPFTAGGLDNPDYVAVDGAGTVWFANYNGLTALAPDGSAISPALGYTGEAIKTITGIAIDGSGNIWMPSYQGEAVVEVVGAASPVVTPMSAALASHSLGMRP